MPLANYGVLKGRPIERRIGTNSNPHYHIHLVDNELDYRVAINVRSQQSPSELEYLVAEDFRHPVTQGLPDLKPGFTPLESKPGGLALDFIRDNLFDPQQMQKLPLSVAGPNNDLNDLLDKYIQQALNNENVYVYAFGQRWGPENIKDKIFGFAPGNGIHDIHMNQGNSPAFSSDDGVWSDGALMIQYPSHWVAIFLKFQSQSWHTDDKTGHTIAVPSSQESDQDNVVGHQDLIVRIIAAQVNPTDQSTQKTVTLFNTSPQSIKLDGWLLVDGLKNRQELSGSIDAGEAYTIKLVPQMLQGENGGIISLIDNRGLKVHGVSYTKEQVSRKGWSIVW